MAVKQEKRNDQGKKKKKKDSCNRNNKTFITEFPRLTTCQHVQTYEGQYVDCKWKNLHLFLRDNPEAAKECITWHWQDVHRTQHL